MLKMYCKSFFKIYKKTNFNNDKEYEKAWVIRDILKILGIKEEILINDNIENIKRSDNVNNFFPLALVVSILIAFIVFDNLYLQNIGTSIQDIHNNNSKVNIDIGDTTSYTKYNSLQEVMSNEFAQNVIPTKYINGYNFESGTSYEQKDGKKELIFSYAKGYGYITIIVSQKDKISDYNERYVNVSEVEKYDITKYTIPFAQSVPEEKRNTIHNPIFLANDISVDVLRKRIVKSQEIGEDKKQTMEFSLDYDNLVVRYIISYYTDDDLAKKVYEMIQSAPYFH